MPAGKRERFAWAMYDFANSGYTTVVLTTIFNAYFVAVVAGDAGLGPGPAILLWTGAVALGNGIILVSAPVVGALADVFAAKKRLLAASTIVCVLATTLLGISAKGHLLAATLLVVASFVGYGSGEYLISAFLPEITTENHMGRLSGQGWGLGYFGGVLTLVACLGYIAWSRHSHPRADFVPVTLWITSGIFVCSAMPTFLWLKERAVAKPLARGQTVIGAGFGRVRQTLRQARKFTDLFRFLGTLVIFQAGVSTVIIVAAIYAEQVFGFTDEKLILMVIVVNLTAAAGAFAMGFVQDRFGSLRALSISLCIWMLAILLVAAARSPVLVWVAANLIGLAMGSCQATSRALVGLFTPQRQTGEFFGLWGLAVNLASIIGPLSYGLISLVTGGNQRMAVLSTLIFFAAGLAMLGMIDEQRGKQSAARLAPPSFRVRESPTCRGINDTDG